MLKTAAIVVAAGVLFRVITFVGGGIGTIIYYPLAAFFSLKFLRGEVSGDEYSAFLSPLAVICQSIGKFIAFTAISVLVYYMWDDCVIFFNSEVWLGFRIVLDEL